MKSESVNAAMRVIQAVNREVDQSFYSEFSSGRPMTGLPQVSEDETRERGQKAREMLALIQTIELDSLPHELAISVLVARQLFEKTRRWESTTGMCTTWPGPSRGCSR